MQERIQKIISGHGAASRRMAEKMIAQGRVSVNGKTAVLGESADDAADIITIDGKRLPEKTGRVYLMLNKPRGYITTMSDEQGRKTAAELVDCGTRVYPVGRLDADSEGLLLFTNDGELANRLMHPRSCIEKVYEVTVRGADRNTEVLLARPVELDGKKIAVPGVRTVRTSADKTTFEITIHEGRNRQVRRMCEMAGVSVARLCRIREGSLTLGRLPAGKWRMLSEEEILQLKEETEE